MNSCVHIMSLKLLFVRSIISGHGHLVDSYCGFSHSIEFNGTIYGEPCFGKVTDWDFDGCVLRGVISVQSDMCRNLVVPLGKPFLSSVKLTYRIIIMMKKVKKEIKDIIFKMYYI